MKLFPGKRQIVTFTAVLLLACFALSAHGAPLQTAVVSTVAEDYSSGAHSVITVDPVGGPRQVENGLLPTISDITVTAYENHFYRIERFQRNNITKFDIAAPDQVIWQFSTLDPGESDSNPYDLVFVGDEKAYLLRFGATHAWIVNPSVAAGNASNFKIGALDLSAYADGDGLPEMNSGAIAGGKLFVAMQRLDRNDYWTPSNPAYVAVFDVASDAEIDTRTPNAGALKGIELPIRNTGAIQYLEENNTIYVQGIGYYFGSQEDYPGGIVRIDPETYAVELLVAGGFPYGNITGMSIVSATKGYFVGYAGWGDNTLYAFNPTTGVVHGPAHLYLSGINIAGMDTGTYADKNGMLWVCNQTDAEVVLLDTVTNLIDEIIYTGLAPTRVVFTTEGSPGAGSGAGGGGSCFIATAGLDPAVGSVRKSVLLLVFLCVSLAFVWRR